jgi:hypothetical protein
MCKAIMCKILNFSKRNMCTIIKHLKQISIMYFIEKNEVIYVLQNPVFIWYLQHIRKLYLSSTLYVNIDVAVVKITIAEQLYTV